MRLVLFSVMVVATAAGIALSSAACDDTTNEPDCSDATCGVVFADGGAPDVSSTAPPTDDATPPTPEPFDAGVPQLPPCKGLFELCSSTECCAPYGCTSGTCR